MLRVKSLRERPVQRRRSVCSWWPSELKQMGCLSWRNTNQARLQAGEATGCHVTSLPRARRKVLPPGPGKNRAPWGPGGAYCFLAGCHSRVVAGPLSRTWGAEPWVVGARCVPSAGGDGGSLIAGACELPLAGPLEGIWGLWSPNSPEHEGCMGCTLLSWRGVI